MNNKLSIKTSLKFRGFLVIPMLLGILFLNGGCQPNLENNKSFSFLKGTTLDEIKWIHGSKNCDENTDPLIQVYKYNSSTWILRQNKCTNYEAPFMFLFAGSERALLVDTGASTSAEIFPLKQVVAELLKSWETESGIILEELIVAHSHGHGDHRAADRQFEGNPNTTVIAKPVGAVKMFFSLNRWPEGESEYDLGERKLKIFPIPGHHEASIALYDSHTKILLTGDTFYPGRLYIKNWDAFRESINRINSFINVNEVSHFLGNHIEMKNQPKLDYPIRTTFQPNEHQLSLKVDDFRELFNSIQEMGNKPIRKAHKSFIIYPL